MGAYGRKGRREGAKGEVRADASERIACSVAVEKLMCTPYFLSLIALGGLSVIVSLSGFVVVSLNGCTYGEEAEGDDPREFQSRYELRHFD